MRTGAHHHRTLHAGHLLQRQGVALPLVYVPETGQWIPREAAFMRAPADRDRMVTQWNHHCIRCHSTGGNPGLNDKGELISKVGELGIACEACHGPGRRHVELERARELDPALAAPARDIHFIINPRKLEPVRSTEVCGQCHGNYVLKEEHALEFARNGPLYHPGEDLHRTRYYIQYPGEDATPEQKFELQRNAEFFASRWWDDGTILAGGREFTALQATPCHTRGTMSCLSCHSMHDSEPDDQLKHARDDPSACTQCHGEERFTSRLTDHTRHAAQSSGSNCLNCHMPHTTYALFKAIRSHQIQSPQIRSSVRHGVPNACNLCHLDKSLDWTQQHLADWHGQSRHSLTAEQQKLPASILWLLKGHAAQRVITAWHLGWEPAKAVSGTNWLAPFAAQLLTDDYGPVRYVATRSLRSLPGFAGFQQDFLATPRELDSARQRALEHWHSNRPPNLAGRPLFTAEGDLDTNQIARLLAEQDQRPVTIKE